ARQGRAHRRRRAGLGVRQQGDADRRGVGIAWGRGVVHGEGLVTHNAVMAGHSSLLCADYVNLSALPAMTKQTKRPRQNRGLGLLRGACHRARIRATRWLTMTASADQRE